MRADTSSRRETGFFAPDDRRLVDTYLQRFVGMLLFSTAPNLPGTPTFNPASPVTPGFFAGSSTVTHRFVLTNRNHATSAGTNEFYKADGTLYRSGCSTAVAQRFQ